jgi:uncharacterized protein YkwD
MARSDQRRTPAMEQLEKREVLTAGGPTVEAQYMLEVLNLVRTNPAAGAEWVKSKADAEVQANLSYYNVDLNAVKSAIANSPRRQPLGWNEQLARAAQGHSDDMAANRFQSHDGSDGSNLDQRLDRAGYANRAKASENAFAYAKSVDNAMQAFLIDWGVKDAGHRRNILQPDATDDQNGSDEVGIGIADSGRLGFGPKVVTQNFGRQNGAKAQIVGVVYEDADRNGRFSFKEGRGDVSITVKNTASGQATTIESWDAGGYQAPVEPGRYEVTARVGNKVVNRQTVDVNKANVKVDFNLSSPWLNTVADEAAAAPRANPTVPVAPAPPPPARPTTPAPAPAPVVVATPPAPAPKVETAPTVDPNARVAAEPETQPVVVSMGRAATPTPAPMPTPTPVETPVATPEPAKVETPTPAAPKVDLTPATDAWYASAISWSTRWKAR